MEKVARQACAPREYRAVAPAAAGRTRIESCSRNGVAVPGSYAIVIAPAGPTGRRIPMPTPRRLIASLLTAIVLAQPVAVAPARAEETIDHVVLDVDALGVVRDPKFLFTFDEPVRWPGTIAWRYNPAGAPASFADTAATVTRIQVA